MATTEIQKASECAKAIMLKLHEQFPRLGSISFDIDYVDEFGRPLLASTNLGKFHTPEDYEPGAEDIELGHMEKMEISVELNKPAAEDIRALALEAGIASQTTSDILDIIAWRVIAKTKAGFREYPEDPEGPAWWRYTSTLYLAITKGYDDGPAKVSALPEGSPALWAVHSRTEYVDQVF
jgi:hypothetical protein